MGAAASVTEADEATLVDRLAAEMAKDPDKISRIFELAAEKAAATNDAAIAAASGGSAAMPAAPGPPAPAEGADAAAFAAAPQNPDAPAQAPSQTSRSLEKHVLLRGILDELNFCRTQPQAYCAEPVTILQNAVVTSKRAAQGHSYGPHPHSCEVLHDFLTGSSSPCSRRASSTAWSRSARARTCRTS